MGYVLGIDIGTGSLKGVVFNKTGKLVASSSATYPLSNPAPGYSEQAPEDWVKACDKVIFSLINDLPYLKDKLEGISFSGQMHSLVLLDENYNVLRPAILWNDVRNSEQCQQIMNDFRTELLDITKNIALEGFTLGKILWVQQNEPEIWEKTRHILLPKDYLRFRITGNLHMDYSDAAGTLLLDINSKEWSAEIYERYSIPREYLPEVVPSTAYTGNVKESLMKKYGFTKEIKTFAGGADNACSAVGAGIVDEDKALASIGTSGVFLGIENLPLKNYDGKVHLFNHAVDDAYYTMGVTLAAGDSMSWFKNTFGGGKDYDELLVGVADIPAGSNGLLFTPYIVGERTPHVDSSIRGSFIGIDTSHTLAHFGRAVMEGITFSLKETQEIMKEVAGKEFKQVVSVGGGAKNSDWLQIQADIFGLPVTGLMVEEGPGAGAAMIAAVGLGWYNNFVDCTKDFVEYTDIIQPNPENVSVYEDIFNLYRAVYPATKDLSSKLEKIRG